MHVDHKIRPSSTLEAEQVRIWLKERDTECVVLTAKWPGDMPPATSVLLRARAKRYELLQGECYKLNISHLFVAHNKDDQVETLAIRLARCSGIEGLACMAVTSSLLDLILVHRPFLSIYKARLAATCKSLSQPWIEDPTNHSSAYYRSRIRHALALEERLLGDAYAGLDPPLCPEEGSLKDALTECTEHMQDARDEVRELSTTFLSRSCRLVQYFGYAFFNAGPAFRALHKEVAIRALQRLVMCIGGKEYGPRTGALERLYSRIVQYEAFDPDADDDTSHHPRSHLRGGSNIGGCRLFLVPDAKDALFICREQVKNQPPYIDGACTFLQLDQPTIWDDRFRIVVSTKPLTLSSLSRFDDGRSSKLALRAAGAVGGRPIGPTRRPLHRADPVIGPNLRVRQLFPEDWATLCRFDRSLADNRWCPVLCRIGLPIIEDDNGIIAVPHFKLYVRRGVNVAVLFSPRHNSIPEESYIHDDPTLNSGFVTLGFKHDTYRRSLYT